MVGGADSPCGCLALQSWLWAQPPPLPGKQTWGTHHTPILECRVCFCNCNLFITRIAVFKGPRELILVLTLVCERCTAKLSPGS